MWRMAYIVRSSHISHQHNGPGHGANKLFPATTPPPPFESKKNFVLHFNGFGGDGRSSGSFFFFITAFSKRLINGTITRLGVYTKRVLSEKSFIPYALEMGTYGSVNGRIFICRDWDIKDGYGTHSYALLMMMHIIIAHMRICERRERRTIIKTNYYLNK